MGIGSGSVESLVYTIGSPQDRGEHSNSGQEPGASDECSTGQPLGPLEMA